MSAETQTVGRVFVGLERGQWETTLAQYTEKHGTWVDLGDDHCVGLLHGKGTLIVTFEEGEDIRQNRATAAPLGYEMAERLGWSSMTVVARGQTWFRDQSLYAFFDEITDEGVFDAYDDVVFYGERMGAYAAGAFSAAAPGARALMIQPVATLDPRVTDWDPRFTRHRRKDWTTRYGYAPAMTDALREAYVVYDPEDELDAMHAALFGSGHTQKFRARHFGGRVAQNLEAAGALTSLIQDAARGRLDAARFAELWRKRRNYPPYLRKLFNRLQDDDRRLLLGLLCANVAERRDMPKFRKKAAELRAKGVLPPLEAAE